jgi:hypothetical protein
VASTGGHVGIVGGAGHSAPDANKAPSAPDEAGQPPVRGAPKAPAGGHAGHH